MDQVEVEDSSSDFAQIDLIGPCRADLAKFLGFDRQPEPDEILTILRDDQPITLLNNSLPLWPGWRLLIPTDILPALIREFEQAGFESLSPDIYNVLHLENGIPQVPFELNDSYTPLEVGLLGSISDSKGCYTGQEIIARQISYDKITQHLCGLRLSNLPPYGNQVWHDNRSVGQMTSMALSPRFGPIALAVIKRPFHETGTQIQIGSKIDQTVAATVCGLPFTL